MLEGDNIMLREWMVHGSGSISYGYCVFGPISKTALERLKEKFDLKEIEREQFKPGMSGWCFFEPADPRAVLEADSNYAATKAHALTNLEGEYFLFTMNNI